MPLCNHKNQTVTHLRTSV